MRLSEPARVRVFVAVDLAAAVHQAVVRVKAELAQVRSDVRWVRDEGLHATMKFLGSISPAQLDAVHDAVSHAAAPIGCFAVRARGLGAFPSLERPRVLWVGLEGAPLVELAGALDDALAPLGFARETRPFHPHVTLGRVAGRRGWQAVERVLQDHWNDDFGISHVDHIITYRSELRKGGSLYSPLWTTALADSTKGEDYGTR
ncbi:MAG TPA: RNA 2',3'-cyclic phosphodiesterase [Candidatus Kryptonia bacterium]|nr:RNA 2',3'-cyclic phosphodiesterase [Candidatus Kryptonia bacterium]